MKLITILLLILLLPVKGKSQKTGYDLAYENGDKVFVVKYNSSNRISFPNAMNPLYHLMVCFLLLIRL